MEVKGYFLPEEKMSELKDCIVEFHNGLCDIESSSQTLYKILDSLEFISGNQDNEAEANGRDLHASSFSLWDDDSPKVDVAAKLKARIILPK